MRRLILTLVALATSCVPAPAGDGWKAVVRIPSHGCSGTALDARRVLTAGHPFFGDAARTARLEAGRVRCAAAVVWVREDCDLALLAADADLPFAAPVAAADSPAAWSCGFDRMGPLAVMPCRYLGQSEPMRFTDNRPVEGRSGGPLLDANGDLVGVVVGYTPTRGLAASRAAVLAVIAEGSRKP